jgi:hypothetical protein
MGTKFWEVVCDEQGIGSEGGYCGKNDAHLGRINLIYNEASGGKFAPIAILFDLEPGVISAVLARHYIIRLGTDSADPPCNVAACVVNSEPHNGARSSVRVCVGPELSCFVHSSQMHI